MKERLENFVTIVKSILYLAATASLAYTYFSKDSILKNIAAELKPHTTIQVDSLMQKNISFALKDLLTSGEVVLQIDSNQMRRFELLLNKNKREILVATEYSSKKMSELTLHNFLVTETEIYSESRKNTIIMEGILVGKDENGNDRWILTFREKKKL